MRRTKVLSLAGVVLLAGMVMLVLSSFAGNTPGNETPGDRPIVPILMYHFFDDEYEIGTMSLPPARFREHLVALKAAGYTTISDGELARYNRGEGTLPPKPLLITIDDGYLNNYDKAYPLLLELQMKATIYAIVNFRGKKPGYYDHFSWEQAREMVDSGLISIQSHSFDSHILIEGTRDSYLTGKRTFNGKLETDREYQTRIRKDFEQSRQLIEDKLDHPVVTFSYPFGKYNDTTEQLLPQLGYEMSMSIRSGAYRLGDSPWAMPRITVNGKWSGEQLVSEIQKHEARVVLDRPMVQLNRQWTDMNRHLVRQGNKLYLSLPAFARLQGMEAALAPNGLRVTLQGSEGRQVWELEKGIVQKGSTSVRINKGEDWILHDQTPHIWIRTLGSVFDLRIGYQKHGKFERITFTS